MSKKTKVFNIWGKEGQERRKRIKESREAIICFRTTLQSKFYEAKLVPPEEFDFNNYPNALCTNIYGNMYLVILDCEFSKKEFVDMFNNKDIFIAKLYKDLDGRTTQTSFTLY